MNINSISDVQNVYPQPNLDESIYYIGHGQLESATANNSILHVISHELGHVAEFKNEAIRSGEEIRDLNVSIQYELKNGKLVAVGGETSVTTQKKSEEEIKDSIEISPEAVSAIEQLKNLNPLEFSNLPDVHQVEERLEQVTLELERLDRDKKFSRIDDMKDDELHLQEERSRLERRIELEKIIYKNSTNAHSVDMMI